MSFCARILSHKQVQHASLYELKTKDNVLIQMLLLAPLKPSSEIARLNVKSSDVIIANAPILGTSISNCLPGKIQELKIGELIASVSVALNGGGFLDSLISANSAKRLELEKDKDIYVAFKATSIEILGFEKEEQW